MGIDATMPAAFEALRIEFTERSENISAGMFASTTSERGCWFGARVMANELVQVK
jgi:hypothetical protein